MSVRILKEGHMGILLRWRSKDRLLLYFYKYLQEQQEDLAQKCQLYLHQSMVPSSERATKGKYRAGREAENRTTQPQVQAR